MCICNSHIYIYIYTYIYTYIVPKALREAPAASRSSDSRDYQRGKFLKQLLIYLHAYILYASFLDYMFHNDIYYIISYSS